MTTTEANNAIAAENAAGAQVKPLFPPGFTYRPPVEVVCGCGAKHTGSSRTCTICQNAITTDLNRRFP